MLIFRARIREYMDWAGQFILASCKMLFLWIFYCTWYAFVENAPGVLGKLWALVYKILLIAAGYNFLMAETKDFQDVEEKKPLFGRLGPVFGKDRIIKMCICVGVYLIILGITYLLICWDHIMARQKKVSSKQEWKKWKKYHIRQRSCSFVVKSHILPFFWPFLCTYVGTKLHRFSSMLIVALFGWSFIAFTFRHRSASDFSFTDTIATIQASIFYICDDGRCIKEWYMVLITVELPLIIRSVGPLVLKRYWDSTHVEGDGNVVVHTNWEDRPARVEPGEAPRHAVD